MQPILKTVGDLKWNVPFILILIIALPVWLPIVCYKIGIVFSDIVVKTFISKNA